MTDNKLAILIEKYVDGMIEKKELAVAAYEYIKSSDGSEKDDEVEFGRLFRKYIEMESRHEDIFLLSLFANIFINERVFEHAYKTIIELSSLSKENKYFALWQLDKIVFLNVALQTEKLRQLRDDLYEDIYRKYLAKFDEELSFINKNERNENLVFVLVTQLINSNHGPSKMLFDRCYTIQKHLGKRVFIINTAELLTASGKIQDWFSPAHANYIGEYSQMDTIQIKDEKFALFQCPDIMPDDEVIGMLLSVIREKKPWCVVTVGGMSIVSDLCSGLVPVFTLPTVYSGIACTRSQFQMKTGILNPEEKRWMKKHNYTEDHFVNEIFTFTLKEQTHHYSRQELSLPDRGKIAIVCSGRLNDEVDDRFMKVVKDLAENGIYTAFAGGFDKLKNYTDQDELLERYTINLGYQTDMLAVYECCDFYLNPYRQGGGCSAAEALFKGLPAFSINYGDVGISVGEDFHVHDYDQMVGSVVEAAADQERYDELSCKARERGLLLIDSVRPFVHALKTIESRRDFV